MKKNLLACVIILSGFTLSAIFYLIKKGYWTDFLQSGVFWVIFMPTGISGGLLLNNDTKDFKLGLAGKILLGILGIIWIVLIISLQK